MFKKVLMVLVVMTLAGGGRVWAADGMLTILHTSQLQGRFQQIMKVGALKEQIQKETGAVVLFDAGNSFSSQEMIFEHPEGKVSPTVDMMTRAGYDAWVLGQAETQIDLDFLSQALRNAQFSVLGANLHRPQNGRLLFQVQPYAVIQAGRFRVGVLGLGQGGKGVQAGDAVLAAKYYVPLIKQQADVVVLLTHLGFPADSTLAEQVADVDLIVGNYSETAEGRSAQVNGVTIRQAGPWGQSAGRIDLRIGQDGVTVQRSQLIPLDIPMGSIDAMTVALSAWTLPILGEPMSVTAALGTSAGGFGASIGQAGAMGYLVSDLMRASVQADIALVSATSLDSELPEGAVRVQDVYRIYAPDHRVVVVEMRGEELSHLMEEGLDDLRAFFYPSGLQVVYDLTKLRGQRLVSLMDGARHPLNLRKKFKVAVESDVVPF
ncbi:MAG: bifunctional metallophosphatase/5'-nucleotidase, partial [Candidatus Latescibacterota bacterium]